MATLITDRDAVKIYDWSHVGESEKAAARKALDVEGEIWQVRDEVVDDMTDEIIAVNRARTAITALAWAANIVASGGDPTKTLVDVICELRGYDWLTNQVQKVLERTCQHDWVDVSRGEGDAIEEISICRKCGKTYTEDDLRKEML